MRNRLAVVGSAERLARKRKSRAKALPKNPHPTHVHACGPTHSGFSTVAAALLRALGSSSPDLDHFSQKTATKAPRPQESGVLVVDLWRDVTRIPWLVFKYFHGTAAVRVEKLAGARPLYFRRRCGFTAAPKSTANLQEISCAFPGSFCRTCARPRRKPRSLHTG